LNLIFSQYSEKHAAVKKLNLRSTFARRTVVLKLSGKNHHKIFPLRKERILC